MRAPKICAPDCRSGCEHVDGYDAGTVVEMHVTTTDESDMSASNQGVQYTVLPSSTTFDSVLFLTNASVAGMNDQLDYAFEVRRRPCMSSEALALNLTPLVPSSEHLPRYTLVL